MTTFDVTAEAFFELIEPVFTAHSAELEYFRNERVKPDDHDTLWGRLTVNEFEDNKRSLTARTGSRLFRSAGTATVQLFGKPGGDNQPLDDLFRDVKRVFQDAALDAIDIVSVSPDIQGVVGGWDTITVDASFNAYYRR
jgi:hypothetical protein